MPDRVALQRGPDRLRRRVARQPRRPRPQPGACRTRNQLASEFRPALLNGVEVIKGRAVALAVRRQGRRDEDAISRFVAIPYATWANRGPGEMIVWLPRTDANARPTPFPTVATTAKVTRLDARPGPRQERAANQRRRGAAHRPTIRRRTSTGGRRSAARWNGWRWRSPSRRRSRRSSVYWFDDTGRGAVRVPASWRVLYKDGAEWKPVQGAVRIRRRPRRLQPRDVHAGHDRRPAHRSDDATEVLGRTAGVEGQITPKQNDHDERGGRRVPRPPWPSTRWS